MPKEVGDLNTFSKWNIAKSKVKKNSARHHRFEKKKISFGKKNGNT